MITDNEGVSNKMVEDSCCVVVGVICGVTEGVTVSLTRKTNDEDSC